MKRFVLLLAALLATAYDASAACSNFNYTSCEHDAWTWYSDNCIAPCDTAWDTCHDNAYTYSQHHQCDQQQSRCYDMCGSDLTADLCDCEVVYCPGPAQCGAGQGG